MGDPRCQGRSHGPAGGEGSSCSLSPEDKGEMFSYCKIGFETSKHTENEWV